MDKLTAKLHVNGRQPVEVQVTVGDVLAIDGPGNIRFILEPVRFTLGVNRTDQEITIPDEDLIIPPADDTRPVQDDIKPGMTIAQKWEVIYRRFVNSSLAADGYFMRALMEEYTRAMKAEGQIAKMQKGIEGPADQLTEDVARLLPIADTLRRGGKWNQTAIAKALGRNQSGGSNYTWITKVMTALDRELERRAA